MTRGPAAGIRGRGAVLPALVVVLLSAAIGVASVAPAAAHVEVVGDDAAVGGFAVVHVRVPTESASASTTRLELAFPQDAPVPVARPLALPGWTATVEVRDLTTPVQDPHGGTYDQAVARIVWEAAAGSGIPPGQYGEFSVSVGPLPDVRELVLPAVQTYDDGTEVSWVEVSTDGTEPEHPAPALTLGAAVAGHGAVPAAVVEPAGTHHDTVRAQSPGISVIDLAALAVALVALGVAVAGWRRARAQPG